MERSPVLQRTRFTILRIALQAAEDTGKYRGLAEDVPIGREEAMARNSVDLVAYRVDHSGFKTPTVRMSS
jgi:hypothetical protein